MNKIQFFSSYTRLFFILSIFHLLSSFALAQNATLNTVINGEEGVSAIRFQVDLDAPNTTGSTVTFDLDPSPGGTATIVTDYSDFTGSTISILNGASSGFLDVAVVDDNFIEVSETLTASISNPSSVAVTIVGSSAGASITDNESNVSATLSTTAGGQESGAISIEYTVTITKENQTGSPISFDINPISGSATAGSDFTDFTSSTISVPNNSSTGVFSVTVIDDALFENDETLVAQIDNPSFAAIDPAASSSSATITDDDNGPGAVSASIALQSAAAEGGASAIFEVTLSKANNTGSAITFSINPGAGTATTGDDFTDFSSSTLSVPDGSSTGTFTVTVNDDNLIEATETIIAVISAPSDPAIAIATDNASSNITDNDINVDANLSLTANGNEAGPVSITYTVTLDKENQTGSDISFDIAPTGGSATAVSDYADFAGQTISVMNGSTTGTLDIVVVDDSSFENDETVTATISNPSIPAVVLGTASATATITDNDNAPASVSASIAPVTNGAEAGTVAARFEVTLSQANNTGSSITFDINPTGGTATNGTDYTDFTGGTVTILNGASSGFFDVAILDDNLIEVAETISATISNPSDAAVTIGTSSASVSIVDDEVNVAANLSAVSNGNETGPSSVVFQVTLDNENRTGAPIVIDIDPNGGTATPGSDLTDFVGQSISIPNASNQGTLTLTVTDDALFENTETIGAVISNPSIPAVVLGTATASATITDNDNTPGSITADLSQSAPGNESGSVGVEFSVTLSKQNDSSSPINFTINTSALLATAGDDFTNVSGGTISVPAGSSVGTLLVAVVDDALFENDETLEATISAPSDPAFVIGAATATGTILDDDNIDVDLSLSESISGNENGSVAIEFTATLERVNNTLSPITVEIDPSGGTATLGLDYGAFAGTILEIPIGQSAATLSVPVVNDSSFENNETVVATISSPSDAGILIGTASATATLIDDDNVVGSINATVNVEPVVTETGPDTFTYSVIIAKKNNTGAPITFSLNPTGGSATAGTDYADFTGTTISIPSGSSSSSVSFSVVDDVLFENNETLTATLSSPSDPAIAIASPSKTTTIEDNDNVNASIAAVLSVAQNGDEDGSAPLTFRVTLAKANNTGGPISFTINRTGGSATAGSDYTDFTGGTISVPDGSAIGDLAVPVSDDALFENNESVSALIFAQSDPAIRVTSPRITGTIVDNDNAPSSVDASITTTTNGSETGPVNVVYTVTLSKVNNTPSSITMSINNSGGSTTAGSDFTDFGTGTVSIARGSATGTYTVLTIDDNLFEAGTEDVQVTISSPSSPAINLVSPTASATITDNDGPLTANLSVLRDGDENGPLSIRYQVRLPKINNTGAPITFDIDATGGSAIAGTDYVAFGTGTISIPNGSDVGVFSVTVINDGLMDGATTLQSTISNSSNPSVSIGTAVATANIADDDTVLPMYEANLTVLTDGDEDGPTAIEYEVVLNQTNTSGVAITYTINPTGGSATLTDDYADFSASTISVAPGASSGTLSVAVVDDALWENEQTVQATISAPSTGTIGSSTATATIFDDDNAQGTIGIVLSTTQNGNETGTVPIIYSVSLAKINNTGVPVTFSFNPNGGRATAGADYTSFAGSTITIPNGSDSATVTVPVNDDLLFENNEPVGARITNPSDAAVNLTSGNSLVSAVIIDDDNPVAGIDANLAATQNGEEDGRVSIVYTVTIDQTNHTGTNISFPISATGGQATSGSDYIVFGSGSVSVANGSSTGTFTVLVTDDSAFENNEGLELTIGSPADPAINVNTAAATGLIIDDDNATNSVDASISVTKNGQESGPVSVIYNVTLAKTNYSVNGAITLDIDPTGGTATATDDYTDFAGQQITIPFGQSFGRFTVVVNDDTDFENDETLVATISNPNDPAINIATASAQADIIDNDNTANSIEATLSATTSGDEDGPISLVYTVTLSKVNSTGSPINFQIDPTGGTATVVEDFLSFSGSTISVPDGNDTGTFSVTIVDDALFENSETLISRIASPSDAAVFIGTASATGTIIDNDNGAAAVGATLSVTTNGNEAGPVGITYAVTLDKVNNTGGDITINLDPIGGGSATIGTDFADFSGTVLTIPDGQGSISFGPIAVTNDALFENTETAVAQISAASDPAIGYTVATATANILDNDNINVSANLSGNRHGNEAGPVTVRYRVQLGRVNNTHAPITFDINRISGTATAGSDFVDFNGTGTITVADGSNVGIFDAVVIDDTLFESTETLTAQISNPSDAGILIGTSSASRNIIDNDSAAMSVDADLSITQNGDETGPAAIIARVDLAKVNNTASPISFTIAQTAGSATAGSDYTNGGTITVPVGQSFGTLTIPVIDDTLFENGETATFSISAPSNAAINLNTPSAAATITDNDNGPLSIDADLSATTSGNEQGTVSIVYTVTLAKVNNTGSAIAFDIDPDVGGSATLASDYVDYSATGSISVPNGSATGTFSVAVLDDALFENSETAVATISNAGDPAIVINTASATGTILDNDNAAASITTTLTAEQDGDEDGLVNIVYRATLSKANNTHGPITLTVDPDGGNADAGAGLDYIDFTGAILTIADGASFGEITVTVNQDALFENDETVIATVSASSDPALSLAGSSATAMIADDDNPLAGISATFSITQSGSETGPVAIVARVDIGTTNNTHQPINFTIARNSGTAVSADYTNGGTISVPDGAAFGTLTIPVVNDALYELLTESVLFEISSPSDPAINITTATDTATITDNDDTTANLSVATQGNEAGPVSIVHRVTLANVNATGAPLVFDIDPSGGTATATDDYVDYAGATVSVPNNSAIGTLSVVVVDDMLFENNETVTSTLSNSPSGRITLGTTTSTATIVDNDNAPASINADLSVSQQGSEAGPTAIIYRVTIAKVNDTGSNITFNINPTAGNATVGGDFTDFSGSVVTIAPGASFGEITVPVTADTLFENDETVVATISAASDPALTLNTPSATATITDTDNAPLSVDANLTVTTNGVEGGTNIVYQVALAKTNNTHAAIVFDIDPTAGSAIAGTDYTDFAGGSISVADGASTGTLTVNVTNDALFENVEDVTATISSPSDGAINIATPSALATITDNDDTTANLSVSTQGNENGPVAIVYQLTMLAENGTGAPLSFDVDPNGGTATLVDDLADFTGSTISVANGSSTGTLSVAVVDDMLFENDETATALLSNSPSARISIGTASATANLIDDDNTAGSINSDLTVTQQGSEAGPLSIVYRVTIAKVNNTGSNITFNINPTAGNATAGGDYTDFSGSVLTIAPGASFAEITVPVTADTLFENDETVVATISAASDPALTLNTPSATATITDTDNAPLSVNANLTVTTNGVEGGTNIVYQLALAKTNNTHSAITFDIDPTAGSAISGTDYTDFSGGSISVLDGASTGTLTVVVTNDLLFENQEDVTATIASPSDGAVSIVTASALATITDNDDTTANLSVTTQGSETGPTAIVYSVVMLAENGTGSPLSFDIDPNGGTATLVDDLDDFTGSTIAIANGATTGTLSVPVINDALFENSETAIALLSNSPDARVSLGTTSATASITDNDNAAGSINADLSVVQQGSEVGPQSITLRVTLAQTNNTGAPITFDVDPTGGNATAGSDYVDFAGSTISVADGSNVGEITIVVNADTLFENLETLIATISNATDAAIAINTPTVTANIVDNDNAAASIDADLSVMTQGSEVTPTAIVYKVTLAKANNTHTPIVFDIDPTSGTASVTDDIVDFTGSQISVADGSSEGTIVVPVVDDALFENLEDVIATISSPSDAAIAINTANATATITDDDDATISLSVTTQGDETGPVDIVYTATLSAENGTGAALTFDIDPSGGTATAGDDYTDFAGNTISIGAGNTTETLTVSVVDDTLFENTETVSALLSNSPNLRVTIATASATANISDDDNGAGSITVDLSAGTAGAEPGTNITYTVTLSKQNDTGSPVTVDIDPNGGTATLGADYVDFAGSSVSIPNGASSASFTVTVSDDALFENNETVSAIISAPSDSALALGTASIANSIIDNDNGAGSIDADLSVTTNGLEDGAVAIVYTVTLATTNNTGVPIVFDIEPNVSSTATLGSDFADFTGGKISVANGSSTGTFMVAVTDDALFESLETVVATISNSTDPAITIATATASATITDDDGSMIAANLSESIVGNESGTVAVEYTVTLAQVNNTGSAITFDFNPTGGTATAGDDFTDFTGGTISVPNGSATGTFSVAVIQDVLFENDETILATISNPSNASIAINTATATGNILDDDNAAASVGATLSVTQTGNEAGPVSIEYTITLGSVNNTGAPITFDIDPSGGNAIAGADYTDFAGQTITVPVGSNVGTFTVVVTPDTLLENNETVMATVSMPSDPAITLTQPTATATLIDSDNATGSVDANLSIVTNGAEAGPTDISLSVTLEKVNGTGAPITFTINPTGGTATAGSDYVDFSGATVSVPNNSSVGSFTINVTDDLLLESTETVITEISAASDPAIAITTASVTPTITDEESSVADLSVTTQGSEAGPTSIVYTVSLDTVNNTGSAVSFDINPVGGTATATSDFSDFSAGSILVADGASSGTLSVAVVDDTRFENDETVIAQISGSSSANVSIGNDSATATIEDNDNAAASIGADLLVTTNGNEQGPVAIVFTVNLEKRNYTGSAITFELARTGGSATIGTDFTAFSGRILSVANGDKKGSFSVAVTDDLDFEGVEDLIARMTSPSDPAISITTTSATATIVDNEGTNDDDGDGILNQDECAGGAATCVDSDGDGIPNYLDDDDDNDGIPTLTECSNPSACTDSDSDGFADYLESDIIDSDGDGFFDVLDPDDDGDGVPTSNEGGATPLVLTDVDNDGIPDHLDAAIAGPGSGDSDGDGKSDAEECPTGYQCPDNDNDGVPDYNQTIAELVDSPIYTIWNSFFDQITVEVLVNKADVPVNCVATILDPNGITLGQTVFQLQPGQEFDLIVNDVPGYSADTYGLVRVDFDVPRAIEGHSAAYRVSNIADGFGQSDDELEFSILRPFRNSQTGTSYLFFNTIQPSENPLEANNIVPNWLQVGNLHETEAKSFVVKKYDSAGFQIQEFGFTVAPQGRADVDGGHEVPGLGNVGMIEIIPVDSSAPYFAQLFQYGQDALPGEVPESFSFGLGEAAREGATRPQYLTVSNGAGAINWIVAGNTGLTAEPVNVRIIDNLGVETYNETVVLAPKSQVHVPASNFLGEGVTGVAILTTQSGGNRIISNTRSYYFDTEKSISAASVLEERTLLGRDITSIYNYFLDQSNWLRMFNVSESNLDIDIVALNDRGEEIGTRSLTLGPESGIDLELVFSLGFPIETDTFGLFQLRPSQTGALLSEIRRIRLLPTNPMVIDSSKPLPVR